MTLLAIAAVAALGGAINAIAGGGTLLTFPALIALGIPPIVANATSTVALWPGAFASMWSYRRQLAGARTWAVPFAIPSLLGGLVGAVLLLRTPADEFSALVPWLVLGATCIFIVQRPLMRWLPSRRARSGTMEPVSRTAPSARSSTALPRAGRDPSGPGGGTPLPPPSLQILFFQGLVGIYGGYFGAGVGILMLAALGFMGLSNIHQMNGLKNWGGMCMNAVAATTFAMSALVDWPVALCMAAGATLGGYGGASLAQRVDPTRVRAAIVVIGILSTVWLAFGRGS